LALALKKGLIRPTTEKDLHAVRSAIKAERRRRSKGADTRLVGFDEERSEMEAELSGPNAYTVVKAFTYPAGLYGGDSAAFIIPKGVPTPTGDPGHSAVFDFNSDHVCLSRVCQALGHREREP
jgi:hypothetical protein